MCTLTVCDADYAACVAAADPGRAIPQWRLLGPKVLTTKGKKDCLRQRRRDESPAPFSQHVARQQVSCHSCGPRQRYRRDPLSTCIIGILYATMLLHQWEGFAQRSDMRARGRGQR